MNVAIKHYSLRVKAFKMTSLRLEDIQGNGRITNEIVIYKSSIVVCRLCSKHPGTDLEREFPQANPRQIGAKWFFYSCEVARCGTGFICKSCKDDWRRDAQLSEFGFCCFEPDCGKTYSSQRLMEKRYRPVYLDEVSQFPLWDISHAIYQRDLRVEDKAVNTSDFPSLI